MEELDERPAVADLDPGADERYGYLTAGGLLVALGWGVLVAANLFLHRIAPAGGIGFGPWRIFSMFGAFAWAAALIGAFAGILGIVLIQYGRGAPSGPFVLPGEPY